MSAADPPAGIASVSHNGDDVFSTEAYRLLVNAVRDSHCILFLGAGVHYPPPEDSPYTYPAGNRPPLGGELAQELADRCDFARKCPKEQPTNLMRVSLCYERDVGRDALATALDDSLADSSPSAAVRGLARLPFSLTITTNYDTLFERALQPDKQPVIRVYDPEGIKPTADYPRGRDPSPERPFLFKIHGDVNTPSSIVITDEDYIDFVRRMGTGSERNHPVPQTFRYQLARWPTLFVGYSLLDFNLRLLFRTLRWNVDTADYPTSYSVDLSPDRLIQEVWQMRGFRFIADDVWDFVPRLYRDVLGEEMPR